MLNAPLRLLGLLLCKLGLHHPDAGVEPRLCIRYVCARCGSLERGELALRRGR
jgi:hypothetical protein